MIGIRPWKGSSSAFEVDIIVRSPRGETVRKRAKAPVSGLRQVQRRAVGEPPRISAPNASPWSSSGSTAACLVGRCSACSGLISISSARP